MVNNEETTPVEETTKPEEEASVETDGFKDESASSVLGDTKEMLAVPEEIDDFDRELIMFINTAFDYIHQLGIGPEEPYVIKSKDDTWGNEFHPYLDEVKQYVYLRVRLIFDPPTSTVLNKTFMDALRELEWRVNVKREGVMWKDPYEVTESS